MQVLSSHRALDQHWTSSAFCGGCSRVHRLLCHWFRLFFTWMEFPGEASGWRGSGSGTTWLCLCLLQIKCLCGLIHPGPLLCAWAICNQVWHSWDKNEHLQVHGHVSQPEKTWLVLSRSVEKTCLRWRSLSISRSCYQEREIRRIRLSGGVAQCLQCCSCRTDMSWWRWSLDERKSSRFPSRSTDPQFPL